MLWDFASTITLKKEKNGQTTYYVMHYEPDFAKKIPLTTPVWADLGELKKKIDETNKAIDKKYYEAVNAKTGDDAAIDALKTVSKGRPGKGLSSDFDDDIPF